MGLRFGIPNLLLGEAPLIASRPVSAIHLWIKAAEKQFNSSVRGLTMCRVAAYYRVSTEKQGRSGFGLEAQRQSVRTLCKARGRGIVSEFTEVESGKHKQTTSLNSTPHWIMPA